MSWIKLLQGIGDRLGILESVQVADATPAMRIQTRIVSLHDLATEIRSSEVRALADLPLDLEIPFEKIFEAAGISSKPDEWNIIRLKEIISEERSRTQSREDVQKSVLELLRSAGVSSEVLVRDAIARDQALDAFEARAAQKMRERSQAFAKRLQVIEAQIQSLQVESAKIKVSLGAEEEKWRRWTRDKRAQERELAAAVAYLVDHKVITEDGEDPGG